MCERYGGGLNPFDVYFNGAGGWSPARLQAEMYAESFRVQQDNKQHQAAQWAAEGREVFLIDESDETFEV